MEHIELAKKTIDLNYDQGVALFHFNKGDSIVFLNTLQGTNLIPFTLHNITRLLLRNYY